jgi:putative salt-induced outer membrane protein YdiY
MKLFILFFILATFAFGEDTSSEENTDLVEPVLIEDTSGLTKEELREKAKESDAKNKSKKKVSVSEVVKSIDKSGKVDISKIQQPWEQLSPTPQKYDWIQTKSGEWFKGEIKAMYNKELEFDSDEVGLYTFKFKDIKQIKSYHIIDVNIEGVATVPGIIRYKDGKIHIIQGDDTFTFDKDQIVSLALSGEKERQYWSGKITVNLDLRSGNKKQFDYNVKANVKRRTATTRLRLDYLGRISSSNGVETANDHRVNEKYDIYQSRYFFWTPIFAEYYQDKFQNISNQYTLGAGLGYTVTDTPTLEWDVSGGPAVIHTRYITVNAYDEQSPTSFSLELSTRLEYEISDKTDLNYQYKMTFTDSKSGKYKHHMVLALENELLEWLDFDITAIWDYTHLPQISSDGIKPYKNDYQLLFGLGIEF